MSVSSGGEAASLSAPREERAAIAVVAGTLVAFATWLAAVVFPAPFLDLELALERSWIQRRGVIPRRPGDPRVVVLGIDDEANRLVQKRWGFAPGSWSREVYARIVERLRERGAKAIGFDVVMDMPRPGTDELIRVLSLRRDTVLAAERERGVVGGSFGTSSRIDLVLPLPELSEVARVGHVNTFQDRDGCLRYGSSWLMTPGMQTLASLDLQLADLVLRGPSAPPPGSPAEAAFATGRVTLPWGRELEVDRFGRYPISFLGPGGTIPTVSVADLLNEEAGSGGQELLLESGRIHPTRAVLAPPGPHSLTVVLAPADEDLDVLALPEGDGVWASARGRGKVVLSGLSPGPYALWVGRTLGPRAFGVATRSNVAATAGEVSVELPSPSRVIRGRLDVALADRAVVFEGDRYLADLVYRERVEVATGPDGGFQTPPLASEDVLVEAGGDPVPVLSDEIVVAARAPRRAGSRREPPAIRVEGGEGPLALLAVDRTLPAPPYAPRPGPLPDTAAGRRTVLVEDPRTGHRGHLEVETATIFQDAIVLVGDVTELSQDFHRTPFDQAGFFSATARRGRNRTPGVEVHGHAVHTLISGSLREAPTGLLEMGAPDFRERASGQLSLLPWLVVLCVATALWFQRVRHLGLVLALVAAGYEIGYRLLVAGRWVHVGLPVIALAGTCLALLSWNYATVERKRREIRAMFQHYLDPDIVSELEASPAAVALGGTQRDVSCYFSDIEGFSGFSEKMTPPELVVFMNEYLTAMSDVLMRYGGWVDKFIGDAIVCVFNAPRHQPDHAVRCCLAALELKAREEALRKVWRARDLPEVKTRIGINTGSVVVGNVGTERKKNYTVLGDAVNLAARLEALNKEYGTYLMIGENTARVAGAELVMRELDRVRVKGKTIPASVFEVLAEKGEGNHDGLLSPWEAALSAYRAQAWDEAEAGFGRVLEVRPGDAPSMRYLERITLLREHPPRGDWDGVWTMEHK